MSIDPMGQGFIDPHFANPHGPGDARIVIYGYTPNFTLCILGIVLFALSALVHTYQVIRYRIWYFIPLVIACIVEVIGYVFRSLSSHRDPYRVAYFVGSYFCITTAPVLISASIYVCLNRLISWATLNGYNTKSRKWLSPKMILWGFVTSDVVTTLVQVTGAALIGSAESHRKDPTTANNILLAGLAIQTFCFSIFLVLFTCFTVSLVRDKKVKQPVGKIAAFLIALAVSSILVFLRTTFRLAETSEGVFGNLMTHEVYFGCLEFAPIVAAVWILAIWHPGRWVPSPRKKSFKNGDAWRAGEFEMY